MKKYGKLMAIAAAAFFVSTLPTSAKEYTVEEFGKKLERDYPTAGYVYIIGDYAFTSNHQLTTQDVMLAARSINLVDTQGKTNEDDAYEEMTMHYVDTDGVVWAVGTPEFGTSELLNGKKMFNIDFIDYEGVIKDYVLDEVNPEVQRAVDELNAKAAEKGFKSITFDEETKTVTFEVQDLSRFLKDYADSGIVDLFETVLNSENGLATKSVKYQAGKDKTEKTVNKSEITKSAIVGFAKEVLEAMTGKEASDIVTARYVDVVGKSATATFTFEYNGKDVTADYTVEFVYNDDTQEENLQAAAETLNETAKNYGFSAIEYEDQTLTFTIQDESALLAGYAQSGILDMFEKYIAGATKAEYTITTAEADGTTKDEKVTKTFTTYPTKADGVQFAKELLAKMAGKDVSQAASLKLIDVANKEVTVDVTYNIGGEETVAHYTLAFVYDLVPAKDELLSDDAVALTEKVLEDPNYGFDLVTYDKDSKTVTFDIADDTAVLATFADSGIIDMFRTFVVGATKAEYTIGTGDGAKVTETFATNLTDDQIIGFAKKLLSKLAGVDENQAANIALASVAGKRVTATFTYGSGETAETVDYTLYFQYDLEDVKNGELTDAAQELDKKVKEAKEKYGFSSVAWDETTGTATFTISNDDKELNAFADSGIIDMFKKIAANATKATYTVGGTTYNEELTDLTTSNITKLAARLLCRMAGKEFSETTESNNLVSVASALKTSDVAAKSAEATFTYMVDGKEETMTYKLEFVKEAQPAPVE